MGKQTAQAKEVYSQTLQSFTVTGVCQISLRIQLITYKAVNNLVFIDSEALPVTRQSTRSTRSSSSNAITYIPKRSRTVTYQRSFYIRACRTWNVLPAELRTSHTSLASFKRSLLQYYTKALDLYDADDIRTWRTICPGCNTARTLLCPPTCCF